jgi:PAS domain S-box-containing protein
MDEIYKILVVDDDEVDRMKVRRTLTSAGVPAEISEAGSLAAATAAIESQAFDCLLVDYYLPDGDGLGFVKAIRATGNKIAVIVLTGQEDTQIAVELMKAGASDYLSKTNLCKNSLSRSLQNAVRVHRAEIEAEQASRKLKESEERYRLVLEGSNEGIWDWDLLTDRIYWNEKFFEIIGISRQEFGGNLDALYERLHPQDQPKIQQAIAQHLEQGVEYNVEFRLRHGSGNYRYCRSRGKAQRNENGEVIRFAGTVSDITARKQAEQELVKQHLRAQLFAQITLKIRQSLQIDEMLQTTVSEVRSLLAADRVIIYQLDEKGSGKVVTESVNDLNLSLLDKNIIDPCFSQKYIDPYQKGRIKAISNIETAEMQSCHVEFLKQFGVKANLVVPILQRDQLWGLLIAHQCTHPREWTAFEIELLQQLANQVSIALAQAQLLKEAHQTSQQLAAKKDALEGALQELKDTQAQLIQAEKMSGLGQLVAGIAHEINNPVTFIYSNLTPAQDYIQDILEVLKLYQTHCPDPGSAVAEVVENLELDFIVEDLQKLLESMKTGAERIRQIVLSLRNFSRLDEAQMKPVDLHEGLDSTLLLLKRRFEEHPYTAGIQITKNYDPSLPLVECYAGQINQVFMNLLNNAIDALESDSKTSRREIKITTEIMQSSSRTPQQPLAVIRIADNGIGMNEAVCRRIFEPFFTTKPPGKGTGLGLAISYQIVVDKHQGELLCSSTPTKGTEFIIKLPLSQQPGEPPHFSQKSPYPWSTLPSRTSHITPSEVLQH